MQGVKFTKEYTMQDSLANIKYEIETHQCNFEIVDSVKFMKDGLCMSFSFIEVANQWLGNWLQLKGWSAYMNDNIARFDRVLERVYHRYWRNGQPALMYELVMLLFGTMLMFHVQNKYLGGLPAFEMMGVMPGGGSGGSGSNNNTTQNNNNQNAGGNGNASAFGLMSSLGNIMSMFTGGANANANRPQVPNIGRVNTSTNTHAPVPAPVPATVNYHANQSRQENQNPNTLPIATAPIPSTATVASLPGMTIRGVSNQLPNRRTLNRPSAHLTAPQLGTSNLGLPPLRTPLSPIAE
jgi:hypothetical protein